MTIEDKEDHGFPAMQAEHQGYKAVFELANDGILIQDIATGMVIDANPAWARISGYDIRESRHMPLSLLGSGEPGYTIHEAAEYVRRAREEGPQVFAWHLRRKDESCAWVEVSLNKVMMPEGERLLALLRDIGDRKRTEDALRFDEMRLEALLRLNQMSDASIQEITDFALEEGVRLTGSDLGYLAFLNEDESVLTMHSWSKSAMSACAIHNKPMRYSVSSTGLWGEAVRQRCPVITNEYAATSPLKKGYPEGHIEIRRHMNLPVVEDGKIVLVAGVANKAEIYDESDIRQLTLLMQGMWRLLERQRDEAALRESEARLRSIFESSAGGIALFGSDGRINECNAAFMDLFGYSADEIKELLLQQLVYRKDGGDDSLYYSKILGGRRDSYHLEKQFVRKDGQIFWGLLAISNVRGREGGAQQFLAIVSDISERKRTDMEILEYQRFQSTLISNLPGMVYRCRIDPEWTMEYVSHGCNDLTGYAPEDLIDNSRLSYNQLIHPDDRDNVRNEIQMALAADAPFKIIYRIITQGGEEKWVWEQGRKVRADKDYEVLEGFIADISERKLSEQRLETSLHEKEVLLKEIHHRVKNNLQVVSSMLSLQSMHVGNQDTSILFHESRDRIKSMALIHEKLYQSTDLARINFSEYVYNLTTYLSRSYCIQQPIRMEVESPEVSLGIDLAIPCGLIINELVSNSLKYAFPGGRGGVIRVSIRREGQAYILLVSDNGVGIPDQVDYRNTSSLGLQLVNTLVDQLEGSIQLNKAEGTSFTIKFMEKKC